MIYKSIIKYFFSPCQFQLFSVDCSNTQLMVVSRKIRRLHISRVIIPYPQSFHLLCTLFLSTFIWFASLFWNCLQVPPFLGTLCITCLATPHFTRQNSVISGMLRCYAHTNNQDMESDQFFASQWEKVTGFVSDSRQLGSLITLWFFCGRSSLLETFLSSH